MRLSDVWFTALAEGERGEMIVVSGRDDVTAFRLSGKLSERVEISWAYEGEASGMPAEAEARRMEGPQQALKRAMERDKLAILTGVYTGAGERTWVFYTRNIPAFGRMLNEALAPFERLPISIYSEKDPEWREYLEMYELKGEEEPDDPDGEEEPADRG